MSDGHPGYGVIVFVLFVILNAILYGFGAACQSVNSNTIEEEAEDGNPKSKKLLKLISEPAKLINAIHMATIIMNMVAGAWMIGIFARGIGSAVNTEQTVLVSWLVAIGIVIILSVFGIFIPKKIAVRHSLGWVNSLYGIVAVILMVLSPITFIITGISNCVLRIFGIDPNENDENVTEEEIIDMVHEGHEQGVLLASEAEMITNIVEFGDKEAQDIMTHRKNIVAIDGTTTLEDVFEFIVNESKSRYPVYIENIDNIIGILHFRDLIKSYADENNHTKTLLELKDEILFEPHFVPETHNINSLFKSMQSEKIHMAVVVDEYGQTTGIVTMEDILEEIVGNIMDEYDEEENHIQCVGDDLYVMDGTTPLDDIEAVLGIEFDNEDIDTLNGFMTYELGHIPQVDEKFSFEFQGYLFTILEVYNKMIKKVKVIKLHESEDK